MSLNANSPLVQMMLQNSPPTNGYMPELHYGAPPRVETVMEPVNSVSDAYYNPNRIPADPLAQPQQVQQPMYQPYPDPYAMINQAGNIQYYQPQPMYQQPVQQPAYMGQADNAFCQPQPQYQPQPVYQAMPQQQPVQNQAIDPMEFGGQSQFASYSYYDPRNQQIMQQPVYYQQPTMTPQGYYATPQTTPSQPYPTNPYVQQPQQNQQFGYAPSIINGRVYNNYVDPNAAPSILNGYSPNPFFTPGMGGNEAYQRQVIQRNAAAGNPYYNWYLREEECMNQEEKTQYDMYAKMAMYDPQYAYYMEQSNLMGWTPMDVERNQCEIWQICSRASSKAMGYSQEEIDKIAEKYEYKDIQERYPDMIETLKTGRPIQRYPDYIQELLDEFPASDKSDWHKVSSGKDFDVEDEKGKGPMGYFGKRQGIMKISIVRGDKECCVNEDPTQRAKVAAFCRQENGRRIALIDDRIRMRDSRDEYNKVVRWNYWYDHSPSRRADKADGLLDALEKMNEVEVYTLVQEQEKENENRMTREFNHNNFWRNVRRNIKRHKFDNPYTEEALLKFIDLQDKDGHPNINNPLFKGMGKDKAQCITKRPDGTIELKFPDHIGKEIEDDDVVVEEWEKDTRSHDSAWEISVMNKYGNEKPEVIVDKMVGDLMGRLNSFIDTSSSNTGGVL